MPTTEEYIKSCCSVVYHDSREAAAADMRAMVADALLDAGKAVKEMPVRYWASEQVGPEQVEVFGRAVLEVAAQEIYKRAEEIRRGR